MSLKYPIEDFDQLVYLDDLILANSISAIDDEDIVKALMDTSIALRTKFFKNMSDRRKEMIREDMISSLGHHTPLSIKLAQKKILNVVNKKIIESLFRD